MSYQDKRAQLDKSLPDPSICDDCHDSWLMQQYPYLIYSFDWKAFDRDFHNTINFRVTRKLTKEKINV